MNKPWSRILVAGAAAALMMAVLPASSAHALDSAQNGDLQTQIACDAQTNVVAFKCEIEVGNELNTCDGDAQTSSDLGACYKAALTAFRKCQLTQTLGGLECLLGGGTSKQ